MVSALVTQVFPGLSLSRDGTVNTAVDRSTPVPFLELLTLCGCNSQQSVLKITNAAWHSAVAHGCLGSSEAWAVGWQQQCNSSPAAEEIPHPVKDPQAVELPPSFHILAGLPRVPQSLGICGVSQLSFNFPPLSCMFSAYLPCAHALILYSVIIILPALSILPGLRAEAAPMLEGDNGCQKSAIRAAENCKAAVR